MRIGVGEWMQKKNNGIGLQLHFNETLGSQTALDRIKRADAMSPHGFAKLSEARARSGRIAVFNWGYGVLTKNGCTRNGGGYGSFRAWSLYYIFWEHP